MQKISVIIVNWNVADSLGQCIKSIDDTKYPDLELIVIDNNSDIKPKNVTIQNNTNVGFSAAVNQGLARCTGDLIVLLNPDTRVPSDFFTKSREFFKKHSDAGVMGPKFVNPDGSSQGSVFPEPSIINTVREFWLGKKGLTQKYTPKETRDVFAVSGGCMLIPRRTIEKIGLLTEEVFMYYEDMDYCRRVHQAGLKVYFYPEITIVHEHGQSSKKSPNSYKYLVESSIWYNGAIKHYLMWFISWTGQKLH